MAMAEVGRTLRFINILFSLWLIVAMLVINAVPANAMWIAVISGVALIALSFPKGRVQEKYGTFDKYIV
jgi:cytochrome c biogenesis protein CcdA